MNAILKLADAYQLTDDEIRLLVHHSIEPMSLCETYDAVGIVLGWRSSYVDITRSNKLLVSNAAADGCVIEPVVNEVPLVHIPVFALGL